MYMLTFRLLECIINSRTDLKLQYASIPDVSGTMVSYGLLEVLPYVKFNRFQELRLICLSTLTSQLIMNYEFHRKNAGVGERLTAKG